MGRFIYKHRRGTIDQWKETGVKLYEGEIGVEYADEDQTKVRILIGTKNGINALPFLPVSKIRTISLPADNWSGDTSPFSQVITIEDVTENSKIDLQLTPEQLTWFQDEEISLTTKNENKNIIVYAIGYKPSVDFTIQSDLGEIQCIISEITDK